MSEMKRPTRRTMLKVGALAALAAAGRMLGVAPRVSAARGNLPKNVVLFITDQERAIQHFPPNWEEQNLPGMTRLKQNGLSFNRAFTNACMCSPARSTFLTGYFPAQHSVKYTLEEDMTGPKYPQNELPRNLPNLGTVMSAAGFNVVYKGKWHCSKPAGGQFKPQDVEQYGFGRWDPPDGGANQDLDQAGGGKTNNDKRYMNDTGKFSDGREGALGFLKNGRFNQSSAPPFFLIISLVNPHDVLFYPNNYIDAGYDDSWLVGDIKIPETNGESLDTKPTVQAEFLALSQALGVLDTDEKKRHYLNFYGNLMKASDNYLVRILDTLQEQGLLDDTLVIRTADHGEMGLTHRGQRQKNFNFYEETTRVPLVYSNPKLFNGAYESDALVSHVDFLPTLAALFNAPQSARTDWEGKDYTKVLLNPSGSGVQNYVVFTYDDYQSGQTGGHYPKPPNHIASIREERYKLAEYYDVKGEKPSQWEMYDLLTDPLETQNIAHISYPRTPAQDIEYQRLKNKLDRVKANRLQPLG